MNPAIVIMAASVFGMAIGASKAKAKPLWGVGAVLCAAVGLGGAGWYLYFSHSNPHLQGEARFLNAVGTKVGKHLVENYKGERVLLFLPAPLEQVPVYERALHDSFCSALGSDLNVVGSVVAEMPKAVRDTMFSDLSSEAAAKMAASIPISDWLDGDVLRAMLARRRGTFDILVSLADFPIPALEADYWGGPNAPKLVLLRPGNVQAAGYALQATTVICGVTMLPNVDFDAPPPKDPGDAFALRYKLILPATNNR